MNATETPVQPVGIDESQTDAEIQVPPDVIDCSGIADQPDSIAARCERVTFWPQDHGWLLVPLFVPVPVENPTESMLIQVWLKFDGNRLVGHQFEKPGDVARIRTPRSRQLVPE